MDHPRIDPPASVEPARSTRPLATLLALCAVSGLAVLAIPLYALWSLSRSEAPSPAAVAWRELELLITAQDAFARRDLDRDGRPDFGDLAELSAAGLIDRETGSGTRAGYRFECRPSPTAPEARWRATAVPLDPARTGAGWYAADQGGLVWTGWEEPVPRDPDAPLPPPGRPDVIALEPRSR